MYHISRIGQYREGWQRGIPAAAVDIFPWGASPEDFRPATAASMAVSDTALYVFMETTETDIRAAEHGFSDQVYTDSCMELFLMPDPGNSLQYVNWEFNPKGAIYLGLGTSRYDRRDIRVENYQDFFQVKTALNEKGWQLEYCIPLQFLGRFFPSLELKPGHTMAGNFYKCGDKCARPHYGCWSPIDLPKPDFHCPEFFGSLILG